MMAEKIRVCAVGEIASGEFKVISLREPVAVFNLDGEYFAIDDYCTHEKCSLTEEGYVIGEEIECGWHCAKFSIKTGKVTAPPATRDLSTYEVTIAGSDIFVNVPDDF